MAQICPADEEVEPEASACESGFNNENRHQVGNRRPWRPRNNLGRDGRVNPTPIGEMNHRRQNQRQTQRLVAVARQWETRPRWQCHDPTELPNSSGGSSRRVSLPLRLQGIRLHLSARLPRRRRDRSIDPRPGQQNLAGGNAKLCPQSSPAGGKARPISVPAWHRR